MQSGFVCTTGSITRSFLISLGPRLRLLGARPRWRPTAQEDQRAGSRVVDPEAVTGLEKNHIAGLDGKDFLVSLRGIVEVNGARALNKVPDLLVDRLVIDLGCALSDRYQRLGQADTRRSLWAIDQNAYLCAIRGITVHLLRAMPLGHGLSPPSINSYYGQD